MTIFRQHIGSLKRKKELDKGAKVVKRKSGEYAPTRLFLSQEHQSKAAQNIDGEILKTYILPI